MFFKIAFSTLLIIVYLGWTLSDPLETCVPRNGSYNIGDSKQCDKYFQCTKAGKTLERLCPDGFVYSLEITACEYPHNVDCSKRPILQPPSSNDPHCPRSNGFYPFEPSVSCQKFYHCLEGQAYEKTCPEGVIFDPSKGACIHPDLSRREECSAGQVLNFTCPNSGKKFIKLRFGDHDRYGHDADCRKYFICLRDGRPRVGGCPLGRVFNPKTGFCDSPKNVDGCADYYGKRDPDLLYESSEDFEANNRIGGNDNDADVHPVIDNSKNDDDDVSEQQQSRISGPQIKKKTFNKNSKRDISQDDSADDNSDDNSDDDDNINYLK